MKDQAPNRLSSHTSRYRATVVRSAVLCPLVLWLVLWLVLPRCVASGREPDKESARPLTNPVFRIDGIDVPDEDRMLGKPLSFTGTLKQRNILDAKGLNEKLTLEVPDAGKVVLTMMLPEKLPLDLVVGRDIQVDYWDRVGFGGSARGIRIRDGKGIILLADDGNYGMAVQGDDTKPFTIGQEDANCRNRRNTPGDLNNFYLVVSAEGKSVKLIHGGSAELEADGRIFTVLAVRSTARVGNVKWTDAPYSYKAYVIARMPKK